MTPFFLCLRVTVIITISKINILKFLCFQKPLSDKKSMSKKDRLEQGKKQINLDLKLLGLGELPYSQKDCVIAGSYPLSKLVKTFVPGDIDIWITEEKYEKHVKNVVEKDKRYKYCDTKCPRGYKHTVLTYFIRDSIVNKIQFLITPLIHDDTMIDFVRQSFDLSMCLCIYDGNELIHDYFEQTVYCRLGFMILQVCARRYVKYTKRGFTIKE